MNSQLDLKVYKSVFEEEELTDLCAFIKFGDQRRTEYHLSLAQVNPDKITKASKVVEALTGFQFNVAITKWYRLSDEYTSLAYDFHIDPPKFHSIPLVLITLSGSAILQYKKDKKVIDVECQSNQVVVLNSSLEHRVSKPTNISGERLYMFFGFDSEL